MKSLKLISPAKVNLSLEVLGKRPDGYHNLRTVFERIGLSDRIRLKKIATGEIRIQTDSTEIPADPKNLAFKAAALLKSRFGVRHGVEIYLEKKIPVQAGLGGGSSNAATVLLGLNRLWRLKLSRRSLLKLGATLGSDVPFFILETSFARGEDRGEKLKKISAPGVRFWHCIVKPPFGISTRQAYEGLKMKKQGMLTPPNDDVRMTVQSIRKGSAGSLGRLLVNSLEATENKRVKEILVLKNSLLRQGARGALMSGSGSAVFGLFEKETKVQAIFKDSVVWSGWL